MQISIYEKRLLRKELQKEKDKKICEDFKEVRAQYPTASISAIFDVLANKYREECTNIKGIRFPTTGQAIRVIVTKHGAYTPRSKKQETNNDTDNNFPLPHKP